jgi:glutathione S-transferase
MYTLYWAPNSAAMAPHALLEEIGARYTLAAVDISRDKPRDPDYLKINPSGAVPTLIADGTTVFESAAICMWLNERHPEAGMAPPADHPRRAHYFQWLLFMANTLQPAFQTHYYPERFCKDERAFPAVKARAAERLAEIWARIDAAYAPGPWLLGERLSICDHYVGMLSLWLDAEHRSAVRIPRVGRMTQCLAERPAVKRVLEQHGFASFH